MTDRPDDRSKGVEQVMDAPGRERDPAETAFEALYRDCRDDLYAYAFGLLRDRAAAEDVTALAFERAFRKRKRFDSRRGSRRAWLFGIARNAALDELRKAGRRAALIMEPEDSTSPRAEDHAEISLSRAALRDALAALEPRERELIALKFFAGLGNSEIATVLGISASNAGTRLHRTIDKLRRSCDEAA